ncbi:MAG TPA: hypothetical protein VHN18_05395, partial [Micromonosporaceae bacterium]|nr:hypothetical protein [Micromonosporaceae bacterium]
MLDILEAALLARLRPVAGLGLVHDTSTQISQSAGSLSIASLTGGGRRQQHTSRRAVQALG